MELIRITHDNLAQEHICCAISNPNDIQVVSKKAWLDARLDEGLVFLKGNAGANALLSIFRQNTPGRRSMRTDTCSSTACGYPASTRAMATPTFC